MKPPRKPVIIIADTPEEGADLAYILRIRTDTLEGWVVSPPRQRRLPADCFAIVVLRKGDWRNGSHEKTLLIAELHQQAPVLYVRTAELAPPAMARLRTDMTLYRPSAAALLETIKSLANRMPGPKTAA